MDLIGCMECDDETFSSKLEQIRNETSRLTHRAETTRLFNQAKDMTVDIEKYDAMGKQQHPRNSDATDGILHRIRIAAIYSLVCGFVITMAVIVFVQMI